MFELNAQCPNITVKQAAVTRLHSENKVNKTHKQTHRICMNLKELLER